MKSRSFPKISIVTPSYNQGSYIETTIRSVLLQDYPHLEYIIMDGGSGDETLDVLQEYDQEISYWESTEDRGQTHAINKGFRRATGEVIGWLNSDDFLLPHALKRVARHFVSEPKADLVSGGGVFFTSETEHYPVRPCARGLTPTLPMMLAAPGNIIQQHSTFWRRRVLDAVGDLNESYDYAMDFEFFLRCCDTGLRFSTNQHCLAAFRQHAGQKSREETGGQYQQEMRRATQPYLGQSLATSSLSLQLHRWLFRLFSHRDQHPRLGLYFSCDIDLRRWIEQIQDTGRLNNDKHHVRET